MKSYELFIVLTFLTTLYIGSILFIVWLCAKVVKAVWF